MPLPETLSEARAEMRAANASAIERASYLPDLRPRGARSTRTAPVVLIHDGHNRDVLAAIESGLGAGLHGSDRFVVLHGLPPGDELGSLAYFLDHHQPREAVLVPALAERDDLAALCTRAQVRCIRIGSPDLPGCNARTAAATAVKWLIALGHSRIGLVAGPDRSPSARDRELGYLDAMAEHGLDRGASLLVAGDDTFESGIEAGRLLLEISPRPTAILACNDEMAVGVLHAAVGAGVAVPAGLSVVGFDDTPLAPRALPPLTSMHLPWERIGLEAGMRILSSTSLPPALPAHAHAHPHALPEALFEAEMTVRDTVLPLT